MKEEFLSAEEAAEILGLKPTTLAVWRSKNFNKGPKYKKIGGRIRYRRSEVYEFIEACSVETVDTHHTSLRRAKGLGKQ